MEQVDLRQHHVEYRTNPLIPLWLFKGEQLIKSLEIETKTFSEDLKLRIKGLPEVKNVHQLSEIGRVKAKEAVFEDFEAVVLQINSELWR